MEYFRKEWLFTVRDFPIFINSDIPLKNTLWHTHDFFELVLVARGHGEHRLSETVSYGIMQGDVFAISAGKVHCYTNTHDMLLYNILFEPEFLGSEWKELLEMPIIRSLENSPLHKFHLPMFTRSAAEVLLRRIIGELSMQPPSFRISVKALFLEFLVLLGRAQVKELHSSDYRQEAIHRAIIHMERNLARKLTLADISKHANLNKNYFCECFRNETGTSPLGLPDPAAGRKGQEAVERNGPADQRNRPDVRFLRPELHVPRIPENRVHDASQLPGGFPPDFDRSGRNPAGMSVPALELARIILYLIRRTA